jgi:hypothetical protein
MNHPITFEILPVGSTLEPTDSEKRFLRKVLKKTTNWDSVLERALGTHLAPILHKTFSGLETEIPAPVRDGLRNAYNQVLAKNIQFENVFKTFGRALNDNGIKLVPLKGIYLFETVYKDIGLRHLSDIDVLVKESNLDEICDLIAGQGYEVTHSFNRSSLEDKFFRHAHPRTLVNGDVRIELHTHLYNYDQASELSEDDLWEDTHQESFLGIQISQFSNEMLLQHLCLHLHKHLYEHELKILNFCDIREFLRLKREVFDWKRFERMAMKHGCLADVSQILYLCKTYWNVEVPMNLSIQSISKEALKERYWYFMTGVSRGETAFFQNILDIKLRKFNQLNSWNDKMIFLAGFVFPKRDFMTHRYQLKKNSWLFIWYVYRPFELSLRAARAILSRKKRSD